jgi:hypothetical protein
LVFLENGLEETYYRIPELVILVLHFPWNESSNSRSKGTNTIRAARRNLSVFACINYFWSLWFFLDQKIMRATSTTMPIAAIPYDWYMVRVTVELPSLVCDSDV